MRHLRAPCWVLSFLSALPLLALYALRAPAFIPRPGPLPGTPGMSPAHSRMSISISRSPWSPCHSPLTLFLCFSVPVIPFSRGLGERWLALSPPRPASSVLQSLWDSHRCPHPGLSQHGFPARCCAPSLPSPPLPSAHSPSHSSLPAREVDGACQSSD